MKDLIKDIYDALIEGLREYNFKKKRIFLISELNESTIGWIGLARKIYNKYNLLEVTTNVGIIDIDTEKLVCKFTGRDFVKTLTPTIGKNIGYLMPKHEYKVWEFHAFKRNERQKRDMIKKLSKYGIPWMNKLSDKKTLAEVLEQRGMGISDYKRYSLPALYLILGNKEKALEYANSALDELINPRPFNAAEIFGAENVITPPCKGEFKTPQHVISEYEEFIEKTTRYSE